MGYQSLENKQILFLKKPIKESSLYNFIMNCFTQETNVQETNVLPLTSIAKQSPSNVQLLLAEDNLMNQKLVKRLLNTMGYSNVDTVYGFIY